jgi:hypothetical protein
MAHFFIDRPIFAWVIAILIMVAGGLSITRLGIERYPTIAPPQIQINANYPGASATVVEDSAPIPTSPRCRCRTSCKSPCRCCRRIVQQPGRARDQASAPQLPDGGRFRLAGRQHVDATTSPTTWRPIWSIR